MRKTIFGTKPTLPVRRELRTGTEKPQGTTAVNSGALFLDNQLCFALYAASLSMTRLYRPALAEIGLTYPQYVVLIALQETPGMTVRALGDRVVLDSGTLTPLLKRMETAGFVSRVRNPDDEREVCVSLTIAGRSCYRKAQTIQRRVGCATGISAATAKRLTTTLTRLRAELLAAGGIDGAMGGRKGRAEPGSRSRESNLKIRSGARRASGG